MACKGLSSFLQRNIKWWEFFKVLLTFFAVFVLGIMYFGVTNFTSFWTGILISASTALCFAVGYASSRKIRCTVCVSLVQCLGGFGLLMVFLVVGWVSIADSLDGVIANLGGFLIYKDGNTDAGFRFSSALTILSKVACVIHYSFALPILVLFIHSLLYVFTYSHRRQGKENEKEETLFTSLLNIINQVKGLLVGTFVTMKLALLVFHFLLCLALEHVHPTAEIVPINQFRTALFCTLTGIFFIMSPFSHKLLKLRHTVYKSFYGSSKKKGPAKQSGSVIWKKKGKRITMRDARNKTKKASKKVNRDLKEVNRDLKKGKRSKALKSRRVQQKIELDLLNREKADIVSHSEVSSNDDVQSLNSYEVSQPSTSKQRDVVVNAHSSDSYSSDSGRDKVKKDVVVNVHNSDSDSSDTGRDEVKRVGKRHSRKNVSGLKFAKRNHSDRNFRSSSDKGNSKVEDTLSFLYR